MKLKKQLWKRIRAQGKSQETAKTYWGWFERYLRFIKNRDGGWQHPAELGRDDVQEWLLLRNPRKRLAQVRRTG